MKIINIKEKLSNIDLELENLSLGDFDRIGEFTAKKMRDPSDPLYRTVGAFFRPQYERGILIYSLIRQFKLTSMLEVGTGRGYSTFCAAKAFHDMGVPGEIVTIDPNLNRDFFQNLTKVFPKQWFDMVTFVQATSRDQLPVLSTMNKKFDLVYIDGAHDYMNTKLDMEGSHEMCRGFLLMDDYHLPSKKDPGIECRRAIDEFDFKSHGFKEPELLIGDRRIFFDDRRIPDDQIDYGQVLFTRENYHEKA